jgi:hypothetical protein
MKITCQYVNDADGNTHAIQVPVAEWKKILAKLKKYEQIIRVKSDVRAENKKKDDVIPDWQKEDVRQSVKEINEHPEILIDEEVVFNMLKD